MSEKDAPLDSLKIYIDKALKLKFKALCALQDKDMSQIASGLIDEWVKQNETPPPQAGK
jgi:parvulin-like peptidyl-prolyl isomerase